LPFRILYPSSNPRPIIRNEAARPGPITKPIIVEIAYNTYFINEFGMNAMYLVVGEKRALVIDAGTGFAI
jgi:glyoxylase-like metal-dependent hydrolase (beta-lactamase superfamily II)